MKTMEAEFSNREFIRELLRFSPRQLKGETLAAKFICDTLTSSRVKYKEQRFTTFIPQTKKAFLFADHEKIQCQACCYVSGAIGGKSTLLSSLIPSRFFLEKSNINFNPECPETISCSNFYFAPALAIPRDEVQKLLVAKQVKGRVIVKKTKHRAVNILVGNTKNPQTVCFAHYDSINMGAIDNASGVAVIMDAILSKPDTLTTTLYVFSANEELSYDKPTYWGHGFRAFEQRFFEILQKAKKIIVIDSLGNGHTHITQDPNLQYLSFPVKNIEGLRKKIFAMSGNFHHLMSVYHSDADDMSGLRHRYLKEATQKLLALCT